MVICHSRKRKVINPYPASGRQSSCTSRCLLTSPRAHLSSGFPSPHFWGSHVLVLSLRDKWLPFWACDRIVLLGFLVLGTRHNPRPEAVRSVTSRLKHLRANSRPSGALLSLSEWLLHLPGSPGGDGSRRPANTQWA